MKMRNRPLHGPYVKKSTKKKAFQSDNLVPVYIDFLSTMGHFSKNSSLN